MNDKNIEDFQQWNLLGNKGQKGIMDRLRNPKLSCNHLDCQNCHTLRNTLTQYKEALREIIKECEEWVVPGAENSNNCENNHCVEVDDLKSLITKAKTLIE